MNKLINQAFTLIELLVAIAIVGILSGLIVVAMGGMTQKATIAKSQVFSNSLKSSLMLNLVSEWKLDNDANDSWSGGNNGSIVGATPITDCVYGTCYNFDGNGDYISVPTNANQDITDTITMSAWVKTTANQPNTYPFVFGKYWRYLIVVPQGTNAAQINLLGVSDSVTSSSNLILNQWNLVVGTYDKNGGSNNLKIYLNGVLSNQKTATGSISTAGNPIFFGVADLGWTTVGFVGQVDEVRLYNKVMPTSQIKEYYYAGLNSLLANGSINAKEYGEKMNSIAQK